MTIQVVQAQDATGINAHFIPSDVTAVGYDTGSGGIPWTKTQFASRILPFPAIHIDQDPNAWDTIADILDVEAGAATIPEIIGWIGKARANFLAGTRPGQRWPGIYLSMNNLDPAVKSLQAAGVINVPFWTAQPTIGLAAATTRVATATGPYPCIGVQYKWGTVVDFDVFSKDWLTKVSVPTPPPPVVLQQGHWNWCRKCQGLFYGVNRAKSICPAGGTHDNTGSGNYTLSDIPLPPV